MHFYRSHHQQNHPHREDLSRILDPAYVSSSTRRASSSSDVFYLDPYDGDLHDPDYQIFPTLPPKTRAHFPPPVAADEELDELDLFSEVPSHHHHQRRNPSPSPNAFLHPNQAYYYPHSSSSSHRRASFASYSSRGARSSGYHPHHHHGLTSYTPSASYTPPTLAPRSLDSAETALDDDDDASSFIPRTDRSASSSKLLAPWRTFQRRRRSPDTTPSSSSPPDTALLSSTPTPSPASAALGRTNSHTHPNTPNVPVRRTVSLHSHHSAGRRSRASARSDRGLYCSGVHDTSGRLDEAEDEDDDDDGEQEVQAQETPEWTPTCGDVLRRQWEGAALRVRLGIFRTQKRLKAFRRTTSFGFGSGFGFGFGFGSVSSRKSRISQQRQDEMDLHVRAWSL